MIGGIHTEFLAVIFKMTYSALPLLCLYVQCSKQATGLGPLLIKTQDHTLRKIENMLGNAVFKGSVWQNTEPSFGLYLDTEAQYLKNNETSEGGFGITTWKINENANFI